jgi:hypothetical protein
MFPKRKVSKSYVSREPLSLEIEFLEDNVLKELCI